MDEAEAVDSPARPAEANLAIGCLTLLSLQQLHEGCLYLFGRPSLGLSNLHDAWLILLILFVGLAAGLWTRSRTAGWLTVGLVGMIAVIHLSQSLEAIHRSYQPEPQVTGTVECSFRPNFDPFTVDWLIAKNAFLAAAPVLVLLGRLRATIRRNG